MEDASLLFAFDESILAQFEQRYQQVLATKAANPWLQVVVKRVVKPLAEAEKKKLIEDILKLQKKVR